MSGPKDRLGLRGQLLTQMVVVVVGVALAVLALIVANNSRRTADDASTKADAGVSACQRQIETYESGTKLRRAIRDEFETNARIRRQTADWLTDGAVGARDKTAARRVLELALAYSEAASESMRHMRMIDIPPKPDCEV